MMAVACQAERGAMIERPSQEEIEARKEQNRYAREVIAGTQVQLSHRASNAVPLQPPRAKALPRSLPSAGSPTQMGYFGALLAIGIASLILYLLLDFTSASVGLFLLSLVLMAGWFVFSKSPPATA